MNMQTAVCRELQIIFFLFVKCRMPPCMNIVIGAALPTLVYLASVLSVEGAQRAASKTTRIHARYTREYVETVGVLLAQTVSTAAMSIVLSDGDARMWSVLVGMCIVDTVEYWCHRAMHRTPWAYKHMHHTHHSIAPQPFCALLNSSAEALFTGMWIAAGFLLLQIPWQSFVIVTSLGSAKTVWDHSHFSQQHALHHARPNVNFEQPFFTVWDRVMGTFAHG
jgi:sterol desaturase/sphingolipid hydroxylase (fatty acid hydroxylase superfamily)